MTPCPANLPASTATAEQVPWEALAEAVPSGVARTARDWRDATSRTRCRCFDSGRPARSARCLARSQVAASHTTRCRTAHRVCRGSCVSPPGHSGSRTSLTLRSTERKHCRASPGAQRPLIGSPQSECRGDEESQARGTGVDDGPRDNSGVLALLQEVHSRGCASGVRKKKGSVPCNHPFLLPASE